MDVPCNSQILNIVKKTTHRPSIELREVPLKETTIESVHNEALSIPVVTKDKLHA